MDIFEWGSGGSSVFFAEFGASIVSVEHDEGWFADVEVEIEKTLPNACWTGRLLPPVEVTEGSKTCRFASTSPEYKSYSFEEYVKAIDDYEDNSFDLIVIDGRCRTECLRRAARKVKHAGVIIFDNSDRTSYQEAIKDVLSKDFVVRRFRGPAPGLQRFTETLLASQSRSSVSKVG